MKINKLIILLSLCGFVMACTQNEDVHSVKKEVQIRATIGESNTVARATYRSDDGISYSSFSTGDQAGIYAIDGLVATNTLLTATSSSVFASDELQWLNKPAKSVYCYFPYSADAGKVDIWREAETDNPWKDGFDDMLAAQNASIAEGAVISLGFSHQFAMLAITRGKGFEENASDITVTLNKTVSKEASIVYNNTDLDQCAIQIKDGTGNGGVKQVTTCLKDKVNYVIVPVGKINDTPLNIFSLTLENNAGRAVTINYEIKDGFKKNQKYKFTVEMRDNQAVVSPTEIIRWDEEDIEIVEPKGIKSKDNLVEWAAAYNGTNGSQDETKLAEFGTKDDKGIWTFLLLEDIDLSTEVNAYGGILEFKDIFDGQGHTITGIKIEESQSTTGDAYPTGFVRTLKEKGVIKRLILKDAIIKGKSDVGAFAGKTENNSEISHVKLIGSSIVYGTSNVGAIVGNPGAGGTVSNDWVEAGVFVSK